jgi:hypothetical protein
MPKGPPNDGDRECDRADVEVDPNDGDRECDRADAEVDPNDGPLLMGIIGLRDGRDDFFDSPGNGADIGSGTLGTKPNAFISSG